MKYTPLQKRARAFLFLGTAAILVSASLALAQSQTAIMRERISINDGWRFQKDDPAGVKTDYLLYDVRPESRNADQKERLAEATEDAAKLGEATHPLLKPWILLSGNRFIKDPAKHHTRPAGNPGGDLAYVQAGFDDSSWKKVNLPHDWAIAGPFNVPGVGGSMGRLPSPGIGWYRKQLDMPASDAGKHIFLDVDGAMSHAAVWLNGKLVGGWPFGYNSWRLDLTPHAEPGGKNQLAIRLDNQPDSSRWYPGAGIYRNVWLVKTAPVHVAQWGTRIITPHASAASATIALEVTIDNDSQSVAAIEVCTEIFSIDTDGRQTGSAVACIKPLATSIAAGASVQVSGSHTLANPRLWGPPPTQTPNRYVAVTTLTRDGAPIDRYETRFGIRAVEFKPDGLFVNGGRIRIQGVNQHHDLGALGTAFNTRAAERQLEMLREMGCNAIRMAHNPPAPELLELTDRMGFLVMDEIFDMWVRQKTPFDMHLIFPDWHEQDLRSMIRRDRNHPSVILWSVGNEVGEQYTGGPGAEIAKQLIAIAHDEDSSRPATASMNFAKPDFPFAATVDVISLNYQGEGIRDTPEYANFKGIRTDPQYPAFHAKFPGKLILSSESAAAFSSRGVYLFPVARAISNPTRDGNGGDSKNRQVSSYEMYAADFGSSADKVFATQDRNPCVAGEFVWTGWDYLGEPSPYYASRSSYFGIIDLAGFKKDRFYLYQSRWRADLPMAHILPHWTWPGRIGEITPVHIFTSGDEAELFLNGKSLGRKKKGAYEYRLRWDEIKYAPGELKVVAYKNGRQWATDTVRTTGAAAKLEASADRSTIIADGRDLSFITIRVIDKNDNVCPRALNRVTFSIEGPGEIVATDNGDATDTEIFGLPERHAFNGLCLAIVRSISGQAGTIRITATADSLASASVTLRSLPQAQ
jgi:beta-galactosidase